MCVCFNSDHELRQNEQNQKSIGQNAQGRTKGIRFLMCQPAAVLWWLHILKLIYIFIQRIVHQFLM